MAAPPKQNIYPGLGLPLEYDNNEYNYGSKNVYYPIAARGQGSGSGTTYDILTVREVAMMFFMDRLTDKPDWHKKVFDNSVTAKWQEEALRWPDEDLWALATRGKGSGYHHGGDGDEAKEDREIEQIINEECFDFVLNELRKKAEYFEKTGLVPTLDVGPCVVKSDSLVPKDLHDDIRKAFEVLKRDQLADPDWHPGTNNKVRNLVHPSLYPLVYNVTKGFKDEVVGVDDAVQKWAGKGDVISTDNEPSARQGARHLWRSSNDPAQDTWSAKFQWLPSNIAFNEDGSVKLTSYVNGLHPEKYPEIYRTLERLIEKAIPAWDQCVGTVHDFDYQGPGRSTTRIDLGDYDDGNADNWSPNCPPSVEFVKAFDTDKLRDYDLTCSDLTQEVWEHIRKPVQPSPKLNDFETIDYTPKPGTTLFDKYRESGLQVIVKMASIELSPGDETAEFPIGSWHVEGQMNERIVGTALFYSDCENITDSGLEFRAQTSGTYLGETLDNVGQDSYSWMEAIFGVQLGGSNDAGIQNWGDVETKQGRLLAFPNIFQHRVRPFGLADPTKPGYRRFIALWLVDPSTRIISTANVPPQRQDWWIENILGKQNTRTMGGDIEEKQQKTSEFKDKDMVEVKVTPSLQSVQDVENKVPFLAQTLREKLPAELLLDVSQRLTDTKSLPMSAEEAKAYRAELMKERSSAAQEIESTWQRNTYHFCEH